MKLAFEFAVGGVRKELPYGLSNYLVAGDAACLNHPVIDIGVSKIAIQQDEHVIDGRKDMAKLFASIGFCFGCSLGFPEQFDKAGDFGSKNDGHHRLNEEINCT